MVGIAGDAVEYGCTHHPACGGLNGKPRSERGRRENGRAVFTRLREIRADAVRAADEQAGRVERIELGIEIVKPNLQRATRERLFDPCLVEAKRPHTGFDIARRLRIAGKAAERLAVVVEAVDVDAGAFPSGKRLEVRLGDEVEIVEIAAAAFEAAGCVRHHLARIGRLKQQRSLVLVDLSAAVRVAVRKMTF